MPGCNLIGPQFPCFLKKEPELDLLVAHHVGIWGYPVLISLEHVVYYPFSVLFEEVPGIKRDAKVRGRKPGRSLVVLRRASFSFLPALHIHPYNVKTASLQQSCRNRTVNAA